MKKRKSVIHHYRCRLCKKKLRSREELHQHSKVHGEKELLELLLGVGKYPEIYLFLLRNPGRKNYTIKNIFGRNSGTDAHLANMRDYDIISVDSHMEGKKKICSNRPNMDLLISYLFKHKLTNVSENLKTEYTKMLRDEKIYPLIFSNDMFGFFGLIDKNGDVKKPVFTSMIDLLGHFFLLAFKERDFFIPYTLEDYEKIKELSKRIGNNEILKIYEKSGRYMFNDFYRSYALRFKKFSKEFIRQCDEEHKLLTKSTFESFLRETEKNKDRNRKEIEKYHIGINW